MKDFEENSNFFNIVKQALGQPKTQDCGITVSEIHSRLDAYRDKITALLNKPPPKTEEKKAADPPKDEPMGDAPKTDAEGDAKMDDA